MTKYKRARILSVGSYVPENVMKNADFEKILDTSDEWIRTRSGIKERHMVPRDQDVAASELGANAGAAALKEAKITAEEVDAIICATFTPDSFFPSTACRIQARLGCKNAFAFDISAACAGFVYALNTANSLIISGQAKTVLVVGAEVISKTLDWTDRTTAVLFGDGAGAVVLQGTDDESKGIVSTYLGSDGTLGDILQLAAWGDQRTIKMKGNEVFKYAVRFMSDASLRVLKESNLTVDQIDYVVPHQANIRIISAVCDQVQLPLSKVVVNLDRFGNTSSASIPLALDEVWQQGKIKSGTKILFTALGGGLTVGSAIAII